MPTAENAKLQFEGGQTSYAMEALTDSGDHITFTSNATLFSGANGKEPDVKPDGVATGGVVTPAVSATNDLVDVAALTCYLLGIKTVVSVGLDETILRAASDVSSISSVTINSSGAIVIVQGVDGSDANFSETRGAAGGPPYIPDGSIEVAQVRLPTDTAAAITEDEIFQVVGLHQERYDSPIWTVDSANAQIVFGAALALIHGTGTTTKGASASYADPLFTDIELASDYVPSENSHSISSNQIYGRTLGSSSVSLSQGSFTAFLNDGISDPLVKAKDDTLWFKFFPDRLKVNYILDQGKLGVARAFPAGDSLSSACTISASEAAVGVEA